MGVFLEVGMRIMGHISLGAYSRYDHSVDAQVRAARRCAAEATEGSLSNDTVTTLPGPIIIDLDEDIQMVDRKGKGKMFANDDVVEAKVNQKGKGKMFEEIGNLPPMELK